jgi:transcriptional regulator of acetoin/glycerol metabolism
VALVAVACSGSTTYGKKRPDSDYLRRRLVALEGNVKAFASELGISRNTLYRWLREEGIDPAELR